MLDYMCAFINFLRFEPIRVLNLDRIRIISDLDRSDPHSPRPCSRL